jgi:hypothetical protein
MAIVAELSYDNIASGTFPPSPPHDQQRLEQAVVQAANSMDMQPYNDGKGKLQKAMDLVLEHKVQAHEDGLYTVQGSTKPYEIDGTCPCPQGQHGKTKHCKHMVAVELWRRVQQRLYPASHNGQGNGNSPTWVDRAKAHPVLTTAPSSIPAHFITQIHGKDFVQYAGLLTMAHEKGLVNLSAHFLSVEGDLALAEATAEFQDGTTFMECADATPANVNPKVKPHYARMALTRVKARALRDALNISMCSVEEIAE